MRFRKVCFFLPSSNRDGAELSALECMDALQALGMQCHVVLPKKGPLIADLLARQIGYQIIPYKVWIEPPVPVWQRLLVTLWNLIITYFATFLVGRQQCDLIITNTINICVGALVAKLCGLPHVWYFREFGYEDHGWRFHLGEKHSLWIMNRLLTLGQWQRNIRPAFQPRYIICINLSMLINLHALIFPPLKESLNLFVSSWADSRKGNVKKMPFAPSANCGIRGYPRNYGWWGGVTGYIPTV
jgi:hypothetical protein